MVVAVRQHLPGELGKHGIAEGQKAITKFDSDQVEVAGVDAADALRARAGLQFCVERSARMLWQHTGAHGDDGASDNLLRVAVFLAAVNEYMCAEIVDLAGNCVNDNRWHKIGPRDVFLAICNDEEINELFDCCSSFFVICGGGVLPVRHLLHLLATYIIVSLLSVHSSFGANVWFSQNIHTALMRSGRSGSEGDSNDGASDRAVLACEALEECALDSEVLGSAAEASIIGHQVAWRLARRAGVKFMQVNKIAPLLTKLAENAINGVLQRAISASTTCAANTEESAESLPTIPGSVYVCVDSIRRAVQTDPFLFGQSCVGIDKAAGSTVFHVSGPGQFQQVRTTPTGVAWATTMDSEDDNGDESSSSEDEEERALQLLASIDNLSAANVSMRDDQDCGSVQRAPVGCVHIGGENPHRICLRRVRDAQRNTCSIVPQDRLDAFALHQLGKFVDSAAGISQVDIPSSCLALLRLVLEQRLVQLLNDAQLATIHARRACIRPADLRLVCRTQGTYVARPGVLPADASEDDEHKKNVAAYEEKYDDRSDYREHYVGDGYLRWSELESCNADQEEADSEMPGWGVVRQAASGPYSNYYTSAQDLISAAVIRELIASDTSTQHICGTSDTIGCGDRTGADESQGTLNPKPYVLALPQKAFAAFVQCKCDEFFDQETQTNGRHPRRGGDSWPGFTTQFESDAVLTAIQIAMEAKMQTVLHGIALAVRHRGGSWADPEDLQLSRRLLGPRR